MISNPPNTGSDPSRIFNIFGGLAAIGSIPLGLGQDWIIVGDIGSFFGHSLNGFDLLFKGFWPLLFTIIGTFAYIGIIAYALAREQSYHARRRKLAAIRGVRAFLAMFPIFYLITLVNNYDPTSNLNPSSLGGVLTGLAQLLTTFEIGQGPYFTCVMLALSTIEAGIDYFRV